MLVKPRHSSVLQALIVIDTTQTKEDHGSGAIRLSPDGKWLLASNRVTSNQVVISKVLNDGKLQVIEHVEVTKKPRFFNFDPSGKFVFVCGQDGNQVQVFSFDNLILYRLTYGFYIKTNRPKC